MGTNTVQFTTMNVRLKNGDVVQIDGSSKNHAAWNTEYGVLLIKCGLNSRGDARTMIIQLSEIVLADFRDETPSYT